MKWYASFCALSCVLLGIAAFVAGVTGALDLASDTPGAGPALLFGVACLVAIVGNLRYLIEWGELWLDIWQEWHVGRDTGDKRAWYNEFTEYMLDLDRQEEQE